jgi:hypothetical protein
VTRKAAEMANASRVANVATVAPADSKDLPTSTTLAPLGKGIRAASPKIGWLPPSELPRSGGAVSAL